MDISVLMQIVCILGNILVLGIVFYILCEMPFSFRYIIFRYLFHKDKTPIEWLANNLKYLGLAIFFLGHLFAVKGQLYQLGHNMLHDKILDFFISSPLSNYGMSLFLFDYVYKTVKNTKKAFIKNN